MSKKLLPYVLLFLPFLSFAQNEVGVTKDFVKDVKSLTTTLQLNDKVNVMEVNTDNEHFDISAIDADMNVLWKTTLDGYSLSLGKFKGKLLAIASTNHGSIKGSNNIYKGFLIDPATGKVVLEKVIYDNQQEYAETPFFFHAEDGSFFKLVVRQTNLKRKSFLGLSAPLGLFDVSDFGADANETKDITVMDFDGQLQPVNTVHPAVSDDTFITMCCNYSGSLFIAWYRKDGNVNVLKYTQGKKEATAQINQSIEIHNGRSKRNAASYFKFYPSVKNQDCIYYSILYKNMENDPELTVSKLDFAKNTQQAVTEVFTRSHIKELEKAYVPVNKKLDKPDLISGTSLEVRSIKEENDRLLVFMSARITNSTTTMNYGGVFTTEGAFLINGYDLGLDIKYHQMFPSWYSTTGFYLGFGYHKVESSLNIIANLKTSGTLYGSMDLATGQWNSMSLISKKKLNGQDFAKSNQILWYPNGFIIPYTKLRGMYRMNEDISLQQITY